MQIAGHTFLISGGSSGLGAACVRVLAGAGANVVIADVNDAAGAKLVSELGPKARFAHTEVTDEPPVRKGQAGQDQTGGRREPVPAAQ